MDKGNGTNRTEDVERADGSVDLDRLARVLRETPLELRPLERDLVEVVVALYEALIAARPFVVDAFHSASSMTARRAIEKTLAEIDAAGRRAG